MEIIVNNFIDLLLEENQKQNLVSRKAERSDIEKHVADSRSLLDVVSLEGLNIIDIGSGAGFPGMILAMLCPQARVTLVEADLKKSQFLLEASRQLNLNNVQVVRERAETLGRLPQYRESFDICSSRAVAGMNVLLEYCLPLVRVDGKAAMWKGKNYEQEIKAAQNSLALLKGQVENIYKYSLKEDGDRVIVMVGKLGLTPAKYPRRPGIPAKRPL